MRTGRKMSVHNCNHESTLQKYSALSIPKAVAAVKIANWEYFGEPDMLEVNPLRPCPPFPPRP